MQRSRYVLAPRVGGRRVRRSGFTGGLIGGSAPIDNAVAHALSTFASASLITHPTSRPSGALLIEANQEEIEERRKSLPEDVILEPEILHRLEIVFPRDRPNRSHARLSGSHRSSNFEIRVTGGGSAISGATAYLWMQGQNLPSKEVSDAIGRCRFMVPTGATPERLIVAPASGYWAVVEDGPQSGMVVDCPALPGGPIAWWHRHFGVDRHDARRGSGIKVGVIDSGAGPHPSLSHVVGAGRFVNGSNAAAGASTDAGSHGSHVAGIIGARPQRADHFSGVAPGCDLVVARVVDSEDAAFNQLDIVDAIDELVQHGVDIINMSFEAGQRSDVMLDHIEAALDSGILCVCAAGNEGTDPIKWPAAFGETVGVSAIGHRGAPPSGTVAATREPPRGDRWNGDLYLADFSCFGTGLDCAAPGVGIVSTVPDGGAGNPHRDMCGTSMACPGVSGLLAAALSEDSAYLNLPRDRVRAEAARTKLLASLVDVGLSRAYQGGGVPRL